METDSPTTPPPSDGSDGKDNSDKSSTKKSQMGYNRMISTDDIAEYGDHLEELEKVISTALEQRGLPPELDITFWQPRIIIRNNRKIELRGIHSTITKCDEDGFYINVSGHKVYVSYDELKSDDFEFRLRYQDFSSKGEGEA